MIEEALQVRYVKLHFTLLIQRNGRMRPMKASALRGGIGEMLLRANCIRNRRCESCDFAEECIVQRIMYSKFEKRPFFLTSGDSVGYVLECEDYRSEYQAGDHLHFNLVLFGKTIVYFSQILQAVAALGQQGLGAEYVPYSIEKVTNSKGQQILYGNNILMEYYQIETLEEYVKFRLEQIEPDAEMHQIKFQSPTSLKYQNEPLMKFDMNVIIRAVQRRLYILDCFENLAGEELYQTSFTPPEILEQLARPCQYRRYSQRKQQGMFLKGIRGTVITGPLEENLLKILLAGEVFHIGKNTSFGFGRYRVDG